MRTSHRFSWIPCVLAAIVVLTSIPAVKAQTSAAHTDADTHYLYRFVSDHMLPNEVKVEFDGAGKGTLAFNAPDGQAIHVPIRLKLSTIANFAPLFDSLDFFNSGQAYQSDRDTPKAGLVTIGFKRGSQERRVSFNNTDNSIIMEIRDGLHAITRQEYRAYLLDRALRDMPEMLPDALKAVDEAITKHEVPDPARFLPELEDVASRPGMSAESKKHAEELIKLIPATK